MAAGEWLVNCILEPRGVWTCVSLQSTRNSDFLSQYARYNFFACGPKFIMSPGKDWWRYSHQHRSYRAHTLNFRPKFKFLQLLFWGTPSPLGCALTSPGRSLTRVKRLRGQYRLRAQILIFATDFFWGGPPSELGCALARFGQSEAAAASKLRAEM